jgi:iron complex outermembrane receptor protein
LSKWTYNAAVFYERNGLTARLSYNRRSAWVTNYRLADDGSQYTGVGVRATSRLDASLSYDISKNLTVSADVSNLLAKPFENYNNYQPDRTYPVDVRYEGRYYGLGLRFRFGE